MAKTRGRMVFASRSASEPCSNYAQARPQCQARVQLRLFEMDALEGGGPTHAGNTDAGPEGMGRELLLAIVGLGVTQIIGWGTIFYPRAVVAQAWDAQLGAIVKPLSGVLQL
jgi:hypothetical protein